MISANAAAVGNVAQAQFVWHDRVPGLATVALKPITFAPVGCDSFYGDDLNLTDAISNSISCVWFSLHNPILAQ